MAQFVRGVISLIVLIAAFGAGYASFLSRELPKDNVACGGFGFLAFILVLLAIANLHTDNWF